MAHINKLEMTNYESGVSFWYDGKWVIDASLMLEDGEMVIDKDQFTVTEDENGNLVLKFAPRLS